MIGEEKIVSRLLDYRRIELNLIDNHENFFCITTSQDKWPLENALVHTGLLAPPFLIPAESQFHVVCGFRRIAACRQLGWKTIPAFVLPAQTDRLKCAALAITDNLMQRRLNLVEQARAVRMLSDIVSDGELTHWASKLGLPGQRKILAKMVRLSALPDPILDGVVDGLFNLPTAIAFSEMPLPDQLALARFLRVLRPSSNIQREMLGLVQDIAAREGVAITDLLDRPGVGGIAFDEEIDRNRRVRKVRQTLQQMRFPRMTADRERFHQMVAGLKLGDNVQISHPPDFEGDTYTMTIRFNNGNDMREAQTRIAAALTQEFFDALFLANRPKQPT